MDGSEPERHESWRQASHAKLCSDLQAVKLRDSGQLWQRRAVTLSKGPSLSAKARHSVCTAVHTAGVGTRELDGAHQFQTAGGEVVVAGGGWG